MTPPATPTAKARRTGIWTALGWQLVPLGLLAAAFIATATAPKEGEDWSGVILAILIVVGGAGVLVSAIVSALLARWFVAIQQRRGPATTAAAVGWGTLAAALSWVVAIAALFAFTAVQSVRS